MAVEIYDLNCPFCNRVYKLPREKVVKHVGKSIVCRSCGKPFSVPPLPAFESQAGFQLEPLPVESTPLGVESEIAEPVAGAITTDHEPESQPTIDIEPSPAPPIELPDELPGELPVEPTAEQDHPDAPSPAMEIPSFTDAEPSPDESSYSGVTEHGALVVEDEISPPGEFAVDDLPSIELPRIPIAAALNGEPSPSIILPPIPQPEIAAPVSRPVDIPRVRADPIPRPLIPMPANVVQPRFNLDEVPIARAVNPALPAVMPLANDAMVLGFKSLRRRLTFLSWIGVMIALLLAAILAALLGYIPHR